MYKHYNRKKLITGLRYAAGLLVTFVVVFVVIFSLLTLVRRYNSKVDKEAIGTKAVKLLYEFGSYEELAMQQIELQAITSEEVYNQLTFDNEERTLYTYLKFKGESSTVEVLKSTDNYVFYTLHSPALVSGRKFIFLFDVDHNGKLVSVREEECIDFVEYIKTDY